MLTRVYNYSDMTTFINDSWLWPRDFLLFKGMVWQECKQLYNEGRKGYMDSAFNWIDFSFLTCYMASFALRYISHSQVRQISTLQKVNVKLHTVCSRFTSDWINDCFDLKRVCVFEGGGQYSKYALNECLDHHGSKYHAVLT